MTEKSWSLGDLHGILRSDTPAERVSRLQKMGFLDENKDLTKRATDWGNYVSYTELPDSDETEVHDSGEELCSFSLALIASAVEEYDWNGNYGGRSYSSTEMIAELRAGTEIGRSFASDLLKVSRDRLRRLAKDPLL